MGKAFEKQIKTTEDQDKIQVDALENLKDQNKQLVNVNINDDDDYEINYYFQKNEKYLVTFKTKGLIK